MISVRKFIWLKNVILEQYLLYLATPFQISRKSTSIAFLIQGVSEKKGFFLFLGSTFYFSFYLQKLPFFYLHWKCH